MAIEFQCTSCQRPLRVADALGGKRGKCPHCGTLNQVPVASTARPPSNAAQSPAARGTAAQGGNVMVTCPSCRQSIMAPASLIGQQGACPHCQAVMVVGGGASQSPQVSPQAPSPAGYWPALPNPGHDPFGGGYSPLGGGNDLFGGMPAYSPSSPYGSAAPANDPFGYSPATPSWGGAPVGNPYTATGPSGYSSGYGRQTSPSSRAPAKLMVPAIGMILISVIMIGFSIYNTANHLLTPIPETASEDIGYRAAFKAGRVTASLMGLVINCIVLTGAVQMVRLGNFQAARCGAAFACLPCSLACLNIVFGVWALIVLHQSDVRRMFD
jgi:phage FluMu protein Com